MGIVEDCSVGGWSEEGVCVCVFFVCIISETVNYIQSLIAQSKNTLTVLLISSQDCLKV